MKALVLTAKAHFELQNIPKPSLETGTVLVNVAYCGICGSDLPRYFSGQVHQFPQILGHEFSGTIVEAAAGVDFKRGDKVVVAPLIPCGQCVECLRGHPAMCTDYDFVGSRSQGAFTEMIVVPAQNIIKIPETMSLKHAALVEPLTVAIHGIERAQIKLGETTMIMGAGTIGLLTLLALLEKGVGTTIVVDINNKKLEKAKELGCTITINPLESSLPGYFKNHERPSLIYETAGSHITQVQAVEYCAKKGQIVYIGTSTHDLTFEPETFEKTLRHELRITGSWMSYSAPFPGYEWQTALNIIAKQSAKIESLISSVHPLEAADLPFRKMIAPNNDVVKVMYQLNEG